MSTAAERVEFMLHSAEEGTIPARAKAVALPTSFEWLFVISGGLLVFLPFILWVGEQDLRQEQFIHWYF